MRTPNVPTYPKRLPGFWPWIETILSSPYQRRTNTPIWYNAATAHLRSASAGTGVGLISLLIIGNEILSAQVEDTNLKHMLASLNAAGYAIDEVRVVRDEEPVISEAIRALSNRSRFVISTGGIGPTHDDVTLQAYAHAFGVPLIRHPDLMEKIRGFFGNDIKESTLRLAMVPENTELIHTQSSSWPIIKVANCFVLPGLPEIFVKKFAGVMETLPPVPERFYAELCTSAQEVDFAVGLTDVQARFPSVEIGSYPTFGRKEFSARVTLKSQNIDDIRTAFDTLHTHFREIQALVSSSVPERYDPGRLKH